MNQIPSIVVSPYNVSVSAFLKAAALVGCKKRIIGAGNIRAVKGIRSCHSHAMVISGSSFCRDKIIILIYMIDMRALKASKA